MCWIGEFICWIGEFRTILAAFTPRHGWIQHLLLSPSPNSIQTLWSKNNLQESGAKLPGRHLWDYLQTEGSKIKVEGMQHMRLNPTHDWFGQRNSIQCCCRGNSILLIQRSRFATEKTLHRYIYIYTYIHHVYEYYDISLRKAVWRCVYMVYICTCFLEQTYPKWCKLRLCWHSLALWKILGLDPPTGPNWHFLIQDGRPRGLRVAWIDGDNNSDTMIYRSTMINHDEHWEKPWLLKCYKNGNVHN